MVPWGSGQSDTEILQLAQCHSMSDVRRVYARSGHEIQKALDDIGFKGGGEVITLTLALG